MSMCSPPEQVKAKQLIEEWKEKAFFFISNYLEHPLLYSRTALHDK